MDGWELNRPRLRDLREHAGIRAVDMARLLDCHYRHYVRFESLAPSARRAEPSPELAHAICRVLSKAHDRDITLDDIAHRVPSRRAGAA
jgi:DNA-binding XRE family transcriptional regulator